MAPNKVRAINLLSVFDYNLEDRIRMKMKGMIQLQVETPSGASTVKVNGQMVLKQDRPMIFIPIHDEYWVDPLDVENFEQVSTADIIEKYDMRVERLGFDHGTNILV